MPDSIAYFDTPILRFIEKTFSPATRVIDVGAGEGRWGKYLQGSCPVDAIEPDTTYVMKYSLNALYDNVFYMKAEEFERWGCYDLVIMFDVLEHLDPDAARLLLERISGAGCSILLKVPYLWEQDHLRPDDFELHLQPDLTPEIFNKRYPGFKCLMKDDILGVYFKKGSRA